jgi:hypothetical protein
MFKNIPQARLITYLIVAGFIPLFLAILSFISEKNQIQSLSNELETIEHMAFVKGKKQAQNIAVINHYREADHFYIDKHIESLIFLEPEIESLQKIMAKNDFAEDEQVKRRLDYLNQSNNLSFSEGAVQASPLFQEVMETQVHPVEVNGIDLQKILSRVEGVQISAFAPGPNRPQLLIVDFKLDRKKMSEKNEVFQLNMKLLKREFL